MSGPRDVRTGGSPEWVDVRSDSVSAYVGHGDDRSGGAGHDAEFGSGTSPTDADDVLWVESTALL